MTVRFNHIGHCVRDLAASTRFYCDLLGFTVEMHPAPGFAAISRGDLRLLLGLVFNVIVLGTQIDASLPFAYALVLVVLFGLQWAMRKRVANAYLENQRMTNRMTSQGYTAWDNIFTGNRYNLRLWLSGFKLKLRDGLDAQIRAIMTKEGLSAASASSAEETNCQSFASS